MKRTEMVEKPSLPAIAVTYEQKLQGIEAARQAGHLVLECGPPALDGHQMLTFNPEDASDTHFWFDWREPYRIEGTDTQHRISSGHISGIAYEGAKRRQGWLRRYARLDIPVEEVSSGDSVALRIGDELFFSDSVRQVVAEPELAVATRRLQVPELAISTE
jgi:hypothetical protein